MPLAYIDPGSGSLIIQVAIASIVAVPFLLRQQIARALRAIKRAPKSATSPSPASGSVEEQEHPEA